jgi:peroxiredoxin
MRQLVEFQHEPAVNYGKLVAVSADQPLVQAAFRAGLGAQWTFLSDEQLAIIKLLPKKKRSVIIHWAKFEL